MIEIINYSIVFVILFISLSFIRFTVKRVTLLVKLGSLKREAEAKIKIHSLPIRPMWAAKGRPDITVEILGVVYRIRLYSGVGISKSVHFPDRCWSVRYARIKTATVSPRRKNARLVSVSNLRVGAKVIYLPDMPPCDDHRVVDVLLFNPAPAEVSYVSEEGNSIRLAFTGDELLGYKVFTASTFVRYAERKYREEKANIPMAKFY